MSHPQFDASICLLAGSTRMTYDYLQDQPGESQNISCKEFMPPKTKKQKNGEKTKKKGNLYGDYLGTIGWRLAQAATLLEKYILTLNSYKSVTVYEWRN